MKLNIVKPKAKLLIPENSYQHIARCARVCYASTPAVPDEQKDMALVERCKKNQHLSVLRHDVHYYDLKDEINTLYDIIPVIYWSYIHVIYQYVAINAQTLYELAEYDQTIVEDLEKYELPRKEALQIEAIHDHIASYTVNVITQRSTSAELNRMAGIGISEQSTRYIKFGGKVEPSICKPWWMEDYQAEESNMYLNSCHDDFLYYTKLVEKGMKPEDARGVLPLDTTTKVIYTMTIDQWRYFLDHRLYDKHGKAHENCHVIAQLIKEQLETQNYKL